MSYGITKEELHPSLLEYIQGIAGSGSGTSSLRFLKSNTTLSTNSNEVSIGISEYNKTRDLLLVYKNSVYIENGIDYTVSSDSLKIVATNSETWSSGSTFNFICLANVPELGEYSIDGKKLLANSVSIDKLESSLQNSLNKLINDLTIDGGIFGESVTGNLYDGGEF